MRSLLCGPTTQTQAAILGEPMRAAAETDQLKKDMIKLKVRVPSKGLGAENLLSLKQNPHLELNPHKPSNLKQNPHLEINPQTSNKILTLS